MNLNFLDSLHTMIIDNKDQENKIFHTIQTYFDIFLNNKNVRIFTLRMNGPSYAKTKKRPARISIGIPYDLGNTENLKFLRDWSFSIVAIPIIEINKLKKLKDDLFKIKNKGDKNK